MNTNVIARKLVGIEEKSAMRSVDVAQLLGARPETVSRWNTGKAFPRSDSQKTLIALAYLVDLLAEFYEPQESRLWFYSPQRVLDGVTPAQMIQSGKIQDVIAVVDQLRDGVHL